MESVNVTFYQKLFRAMEVDHPKGEKSLLDKLKSHFSIQKKKNIILAFSEQVPPEEAMVWLLSETAPFVSMLNEIYTFLADSKATILGNADQFSFCFDELNERIVFPLDSFPKTVIKTLADIKAAHVRIIRDSRGRLMVDTPNYWRDNVPALENLSYSDVLRPHNFDKLPLEYRQAIHKRVRIVVDILDLNYVRYDIPKNIGVWQLENFKVLYFSHESLLNEMLELARRPGANSGLAIRDAARELWDFIKEWKEYGEIVVGDHMLDCLNHAEKTIGPEKFDLNGLTDLNFPPEGLESNQTYAFIKAFNFYCRKEPRTVQEFIDVINKVFLPFYRHRWRLFEVWAILWTRETILPLYRPQPHLTRRDDDPSSWEWIIPGGDAQRPVARWSNEERAVEIWYQQKTPLSPDNAKKFKQAHIEPDIRVKEGVIAHPSDVAILELKDRYKAGGSGEKKIGRMYATTDAKIVCVANYSEFSAKALHRKVAREVCGQTQILLVDEFMPGRVPPDVAEEFARAVNSSFGVCDLLVDVSGSMPLDSLRGAIEMITDLGITISRPFSFDTTLKEQSDLEISRWLLGEGGTDLASSLREYLTLSGQAQGGKIIILTDSQGVRQLDEARNIQRVEGLNIYCINVNQKLDLEPLRKWAFSSEPRHQ